jgi:hypothetical protein
MVVMEVTVDAAGDVVVVNVGVVVVSFSVHDTFIRES